MKIGANYDVLSAATGNLSLSAVNTRSGGVQFVAAGIFPDVGAGSPAGQTFTYTGQMSLRDSAGTVLITFNFGVTFTGVALSSAATASSFTSSITPTTATLPGPNSDSTDSTPAYGQAQALVDNFGTLKPLVTSDVLLFVVPVGAKLYFDSVTVTTTWWGGSTHALFDVRSAAKPIASYSVSAVGPDATFDTSGSTINQGIGSSDAAYFPLTYALDPGDSSGIITQTTSPILHTYDSDATYTAPLIVRDQYGGWDNVSHSVVISDSFTQHGSFTTPDGALHTAANSGSDVQVRVFPHGVASAVSRAAISGAKNPSYCKPPRNHRHYLMTQNGSSAAWELRSSTDQGRVFT